MGTDERTSTDNNSITSNGDDAPRRVLVYAPYSTVPGNASLESTFVKGLEARGAEVSYVLCDGLFKTCDLYRADEARNSKSCLQCQAAVGVLAHRTGTNFTWLGRYVSPEEIDRAQTWAASIPEDRLLTAQLGTWNIGSWLARSVRRNLMGVASFESPQGVAVWREHLEAGLVAAYALDRLILDFDPDTVLVFEGSLGSTRVARELAMARNKRALSYEMRDEDTLHLVEYRPDCSVNERPTWALPRPQIEMDAAAELPPGSFDLGQDRFLDLICDIFLHGRGERSASAETLAMAASLQEKGEEDLAYLEEGAVTSRCESEQAAQGDAGVDAAQAKSKPWPVATESRDRILVWPDYEDHAELEAFFATHARLVLDHEQVRLCFRIDPEIDPPYQDVVASLEAAHVKVLGPDADLDVLLIDEAIAESELPRLGLAMTAAIELPSSSTSQRQDFVQNVRTPILKSPAELRKLVEMSSAEGVRTSSPMPSLDIDPLQEPSPDASSPDFWAPSQESLSTQV